MSSAYPSNGVDGGHLKQFIERVERLEDEKAVIGADIRDIYAEVKAVGYDARIVRKIVAARKKAADARKEEATLLKLYAEAIEQPDLFG